MNNWTDWYAAFGPATWRDWSLVLLAGIAGWAALGTLKAAARAAKAAEESNRHARETTQAELRAYVFVKNVDLTGEPRYKGQSIDRMIVTFRNFGRTPAFKFRAKRGWTLLDGYYTPLPDNFDYAEYPGEERFTETTL